MGLCNTECIERIAHYLDISPERLEICRRNVSINYQSGITASAILARSMCNDANFQAGFHQTRENSQFIQGFVTIVRELARISEYPDILGSEKEIQVLTQQWLEYATVCASYVDLPQNTKRILNVIESDINSRYILRNR